MLIYNVRDLDLNRVEEKYRVIVGDLQLVYSSISYYKDRQKFTDDLLEHRTFSFNLQGSSLVIFPIGSYYRNYVNYIVLDGYKHKILWIQLRNFCDGFLIPDLNLFIGKELSSINYRVEMFLQEYKKLDIVDKSDSVSSVIDGWICNQESPYHYFYDCVPYLREILNKSNLVESVLTSRNRCFSDLSYQLEEIKLSIFKNVPFSAPQGYFRLLIARDTFTDSAYHRKLLMSFDSELIDRSLAKGSLYFSSGFFDQFKYIVWMFDTNTKRTCKNVEQFKSKVEDLVFNKLDGNSKALIVHDGMTKSIYDTNIQDISVVPSTRYNDLLHLSMHDFTYEQKIIIAKNSDFFVVDGSTSSIIPSRFLKQKSFCLVDKDYKKNFKGHYHFNSYFCKCINREFKKNSWVDDSFQIDLNKFSEAFRYFMNNDDN
tara:strand:- start:2697 stop:3977 length:1281 start_codon:yes stop_codon:yes gene_type:complete